MIRLWTVEKASCIDWGGGWTVDPTSLVDGMYDMNLRSLAKLVEQRIVCDDLE
jgi:hypothetical protein